MAAACWIEFPELGDDMSKVYSLAVGQCLLRAATGCLVARAKPGNS